MHVSNNSPYIDRVYIQVGTAIQLFVPLQKALRAPPHAFFSAAWRS